MAVTQEMCRRGHGKVRHLRNLVTIIAIMAALLLVVGGLGVLHPAGDSFAVFRLPLLLIFALAVVWTPWSRALRWPVAVLALGAFVAHVWPSVWSDEVTAGGGDLVIYQQNLLFRRGEDEQWLAQVAAATPDLMTLQEVSGRNKALLARLQSVLPEQHYCDFATVGGVAVLSRYPIVAGTARCADRDGLAAMQVKTPDGPLWLVSVHLHWPWPYKQAAQVTRLVPLLETLEGPVVLGGDFNAVAWSHAVARLETATQTQRLAQSAATFHLPVIKMPVTIDHVLALPTWHAEMRAMPKSGSDHHGVLARLVRDNE